MGSEEFVVVVVDEKVACASQAQRNHRLVASAVDAAIVPVPPELARLGVKERQQMGRV